MAWCCQRQQFSGSGHVESSTPVGTVLLVCTCGIGIDTGRFHSVIGVALSF